MQASSFEGKLLSKLDKLQLNEIQGYLARALAQKQFQQTIFDHLDQGVLVTDEALRLIFLNRKARSMLALPPRRNLLGEDLVPLVHIEPIAETIASLRESLRRIDGYECEYGEGEERTLSLSTVPMRIPSDAPRAGDEDRTPEDKQFILILLSDVTERHRRQNEQARAQRLASLATMTSGIAHEIKNPLNSLNIHAQLLTQEVKRAKEEGRGADVVRTERAARVMREETERLTQIVEEFLLAARPTRANLELRPIEPLLESAERIFGPECEERDIDLQVSIDPDLPRLMYDDHLLMQALRNLIRNAIEALEEPAWREQHEGQENDQDSRHEAHGVYHPAISLEVLGRPDSVHLVVSDNGPGIPEGEMQKIFEPYFTTKHGGSGLGLMVVYRIVTEHRGLMHVDTELGAGTRFEIVLPIDERPIKLLDAAQPVTMPEQPQPEDIPEA